MSRAVVTCERSGRPDALRNLVRVMPSCFAVRVMRCANAFWLPPMLSATTTATSLADLVTSALMALSTVIQDPALRPSLEGCCLEAYFDTRRRVFFLIRPAFIS